MTTAVIRKKLHDYINIADDKKVKAIYTMVEDEIAEKLDLWTNKEFVNELDNRVKEFEAGKIQGSTLDEVKELSKADKMERIKQASSDPLFLADLKEIMDDFGIIDNENI